MLTIVIIKISAMTAVCRPSTDEAPEPEELDAPTKLFRMCQAVVQRYRMHGCPRKPGSALSGRWAEFRNDVATTAQQRHLGNWTSDRSMWYRLVTKSSVKALDNLLSVLEKNRQVRFSWTADVCMLVFFNQVLLQYAFACGCTRSMTRYATVHELLCHEHVPTHPEAASSLQFKCMMAEMLYVPLGMPHI